MSTMSTVASNIINSIASNIINSIVKDIIANDKNDKYDDCSKIEIKYKFTPETETAIAEPETKEEKHEYSDHDETAKSLLETAEKLIKIADSTQDSKYMDSIKSMIGTAKTLINGTNDKNDEDKSDNITDSDDEDDDDNSETDNKDIEVFVMPLSFVPQSHPLDLKFVEDFKKEFGITESNLNDILNSIKQSNTCSCSCNCDNTPNNISEHPIKFDKDGFIETDISISGTTFNNIFGNVKIFKLTNEKCIHNGLTLMEGMNVDENKFDYKNKCGPDGIYFCSENDVTQWVEYNDKQMHWIWDVTIPANARVVVYSNKFKADRLILSNKRKLTDFLEGYLDKLVNAKMSYQNKFNIVNGITPNTAPKNLERTYIELFRQSNDIHYAINIPECNYSYGLCLYLAKNFINAYDVISKQFLSDEIVMECLRNNLTIYTKLNEKYISSEASQYVFSKNVNYYKYIPNNHKTIEMTQKYMNCSSEFNTKYIPIDHMQNVYIATNIVARDGLRLKDVEYKTKTMELCSIAVQNNPMAIQYVPINMLNREICLSALDKSKEVMKYIPSDMNITEDYIVRYPEMIGEIQMDKITPKMFEAVIKTNNLAIISTIDMSSSNIRSMIVGNTSKYTDLNRESYKYIPNGYFAIDDALYAVKANIGSDIYTAFNAFKNYHNEYRFVMKCVAYGIHFNHLPLNIVTKEIIETLVTERASLINELPERFIYDDLYVICITKHGMNPLDVPQQYRTQRIMQFVPQNESKYESKQDHNMNIDEWNQEGTTQQTLNQTANGTSNPVVIQTKNLASEMHF